MNDKTRVAEHAAQQVEDGMIVGLGTGSTADCFIKALARRCQAGELRITTVASSPVSTLKAREFGLQPLALEQISHMDLYVDGADEVAPDATLLKGRGQDLVKEKLLAWSSEQFWVLIDRAKLVKRIGERFPVPVEVLPYAWLLVKNLLEAVGAQTELRMGPAGVAITSAGGMVLDTVFEPTLEAASLNSLLNGLPGVLEHGIFHQLATTVFIGSEGQVDTLQPLPLNETKGE